MLSRLSGRLRNLEDNCVTALQIALHCPGVLIKLVDHSYSIKGLENNLIIQFVGIASLPLVRLSERIDPKINSAVFLIRKRKSWGSPVLPRGWQDSTP